MLSPIVGYPSEDSSKKSIPTKSGVSGAAVYCLLQGAGRGAGRDDTGSAAEAARERCDHGGDNHMDGWVRSTLSLPLSWWSSSLPMCVGCYMHIRVSWVPPTESAGCILLRAVWTNGCHWVRPRRVKQCRASCAAHWQAQQRKPNARC